MPVGVTVLFIMGIEYKDLPKKAVAGFDQWGFIDKINIIDLITR